MRTRIASTPLHLAGWLVKATAILAIVVLVTAFQFSSVKAPAPEVITSLVSFAVLALPTEPPEAAEAPSTLTATSATLIPVPTDTPPVPTPTLEPVPTDPPDMPVPRRSTLLARPTPSLISGLPPVTPASFLVAESISRTARVPILMYHYISDPPPGSDSLRWSLSVTPAHFDAQMNYLKQSGFQTITLYDLYDYLLHGRSLPDKSVILTFDDGYVDAFAFAMPILRKYNFVGTFFVLTGPADRLGAGGYLNWAQVRAMSDAGMDMELHSREHVDLRNRPNDYLVYQIAGGKESLEAYTGKPVRWFAYPSGRYDAAVVRVLQSAGFWGAVTTNPGRTHTAAGLFDLQRVRIFGSDTLANFRKAIEGNR